MVKQQNVVVQTQTKGTYEITTKIRKICMDSGLQTGLCHLFLSHTSASLLLCENADPTVRKDLETFFARLVPENALYQHASEGPDDMPAHIRSILTQSELTLPIQKGVCVLGTWQGIYLWEHRVAPRQRSVLVTLYGE